MKKHQVDHVLRAAGRVTGQKQFVIVGSQALHGKHPDLPDEICRSAEVDLIAKEIPSRTQWLNAIGADSPFHQSFGYYADPVHETTAMLPRGWRGRLVNLPDGDTDGVRGLCLDPHDLAISKYYARREKDLAFTRELARRRFTTRARLIALVDHTPVAEEARRRMKADIEKDFKGSDSR
jgi:hypothetical protein